MKCVYVDDFGTCSKAREMTKEELLEANKKIDAQGLEEYGGWVQISKLDPLWCEKCKIRYCEGES